VSEIARNLEHLLETFLENGTSPGEPETREIEEFLARLQKCVRDGTGT
jgi:hypothetical protein